QVSDALAYLHGRAPPVLHGRVQAVRILSPQRHVWMTEDGTAYLCNFDFQPQLHPDRGFDSSDIASVSKAQNWAAPEQGPSSTRRDVFSFAMFLYQLYAGHPPFPEKDLVEVYHAYLRDLRPARPDHPQLTDGVWELIRRCWRSAPYRRPSMKAVLHRLRELVSEQVQEDSSVPLPGSIT
ncbi:kinase-like protein, partial [Auricularia subglabra TFB-10046 SS5]